MLVVSRKPGEAVVIGDNIRLTVVSVSGQQVRLGLAAPAEVPILREELAPRRNGLRPAAGGEARSEVRP
jgi:carbon storage regulator